MQPKSIFRREIPRRHHLGTLREPRNEIERILINVIDEVENHDEFRVQIIYVQFRYNFETLQNLMVSVKCLFRLKTLAHPPYSIGSDNGYK